MRMQLMTTFFAILFAGIAFGQTETDSTKKEEKEPIDIYFVSSYYQQDGNMSPVTGGRGTEKLSNIAPSVYVHVPLDSVKSIDVNAGVDFYTSASSDNIDNPYLSNNVISGASANDIRQYYSFTYSKKNKKKGENSYNVGASSEYDVTSISAGYIFNREGKKNRDHQVAVKYFFDDWKLIYPTELRNGTVQLLNQDKRHTVGLTYSQSFIINRRLKGSITAEGLGQFGLLSTPFHRVYQTLEFDSTGTEIPAMVEQLPTSRIKLPVGLRMNAFLGNNLVVRTFNRVYADTWGLTAYTGEIELPYKLADWVTITPIYRFHIQSATKYYYSYRSLQDPLNTSFYTSDTDLSAFTAHKFGGGISFHPVFGLARTKTRKGGIFMWKRLDFRFVYYQRTTGLTAWNATVGMNFVVER